MADNIIVLLFIVITISLSVNTELATEKIIGGNPARAEDYQYHVGIVGKYNGTYTRYIACSAGIISDFFLLSGTECFFDLNNELIKLRFFAVVGSVNLKNNIKQEKQIMYIYSYTATPLSNRHHLVVLELENSLDLENNRHLRMLNLPRNTNAIFGTQARVAGFGYTTTDERTRNTRTTRIMVTLKKNIPLTWASVEIMDEMDCVSAYPYLNASKEMCGTMEANDELELRGLCKYEEGAPLVIGEDLVVGISNKNRQDCDNTIYGNLYTKVSYYLDFIDGIMTEEPIPQTVLHLNRIHLR